MIGCRASGASFDGLLVGLLARYDREFKALSLLKPLVELLILGAVIRRNGMGESAWRDARHRNDETKWKQVVNPQSMPK